MRQLTKRTRIATGAGLAAGVIIAALGFYLSSDYVESSSGSSIAQNSAAATSKPASPHADPRPEKRSAIDASTPEVAESVVAADPGICIVTRAEDSAPIPLARVYIVSPRPIEDLGVTGPDGKLVTTHALASDMVLACSSPGFARTKYVIPGARPNPIVITLRREAKISGSVIVHSTAAMSNARVYAIPDDEMDIEDLLLGIRDGRSTAPCCDVGPDGGFVVGSLDPRLRYTLLAGGDGVATKSALQHVEPGASDLVLELCAVFGSRIHVLDELGNPPRILDNTACSYSSMPVDRALRGSATPASALHLVLAGVDPRGLVDESVGDFLLTYVACEDASTIGPIGVNFGCAGNTTIRREMLLPRVGPTLAESRKAVNWLRTAEPRTTGTLDLRVYGPLCMSEELRLAWPSLSVQLTPIDSSEGPRSFVLTTLTEPTELEGVPLGSYELTIAGASGLFSHPMESEPPLPIVVEPAMAEVVIDIANSSCLEVEPTWLDGEAFGDYLTIQLTSLDAGHGLTGFVMFKAPPYVVAPLWPGHYAVRVVRPGSMSSESGDDSAPQATNVELVAGERTSLPVRFR